MNKRLLLAIQAIFISVLVAIPLQAQPNDAAVPANELTPAELQADFDLMCQALREAHPGLYRYSPKARLDREFEAQRGKLGRAMSKTQFEEVVAQTLAQIRCGHTSMNPDEEFENAARSARTFPLRVMVEGSRLMVLLNDTPADSTIRPGMEILEINGHRAGDILDRFGRVLSADGDIQTGKSHDMSGRFAKYYWWLVEQPGEFSIRARDAAGRTVTTRLAGVTQAQRNSNHNPVNDAIQAGIDKINGWSKDDLSLRFLKDPDIAEIRIRYFLGANYPRWIEDTFRMLRERGTRTLIIDLRGNGGGEDEFGAMLVSYLTDKPFRYFDRIHVKSLSPSFKQHVDWPASLEQRLREGTVPDPQGGYLVTAKLHPGVAQQRPGKYPFLCKVFILTEGGTFSTAADFCAITHHLQRATFIGEETGGAYYGNNSGPMPTLMLPHSKIGVRLPIYAYWNAVAGDRFERRGTIPDYNCPIRTQDLIRGVDAQMDLTLQLASGK